MASASTLDIRNDVSGGGKRPRHSGDEVSQKRKKVNEQNVGFPAKAVSPKLTKVKKPLRAASKKSGAIVVTEGNLSRPSPKGGLKLADLEAVRNLGQGGFAAVCQARVRRPECDGEESKDSYVAVKIQQKKTIILARYQRSVIAERKFLNLLPWNPFIAGVLDAFQDWKNAYCVLEHMSSSLAFEHDIRPGRRFAFHEAQFYFSNIVLGIEFLHSQGVVHCDLKPGNILMGHDGYLAIADFGMAKELTWATPWESFGSPQYMPPETFDGTYLKEGPLDPGSVKAIDWWSAGCIVYELITGKLAFHDRFGDARDLQKRISEGPLGCGSLEGGPPEWMLLVEDLLTAQPRYRLGYHQGARELKFSSWLVDMPWSDIERRTLPAPRIPFMHRRVVDTAPHFKRMIAPENVPGLAMTAPSLAVKCITR